MANKSLNVKEILTRKNPIVVKPGKYDNCVIDNYEVMSNGEYEYVRFTYKLANGNVISENRFPQGLGIMISHLREQLNLQDIEISGEEIFEPGKYKFTIWVEQKQLKDKFTGEITGRVINISFLEPLNTPAKPTTETSATQPATPDTYAVPTAPTEDDIIF